MFKHKLDQESSYKLDSSRVYDSVLALPQQIGGLWEGLTDLKIGKACRLVDNVVVVGMGGSALGARVVKSMCNDKLMLPLEIVNNYHLPAYVDERSLVILSSYSGGTEEVLHAAKEAEARKSCVVVIAGGGSLVEVAEKNNWPVLKLNEEYNPSKQPRMAIGMNVMAVLMVLSRCGHVEIESELVTQVLANLRGQQQILGKDKPFKENPAKRLAEILEEKAVIMIGAEHLTGAIHVFKNQLNENAKTFAARFDLPELNHHLLEGLSFPKELRKVFHFVIFDSELYDPVISKRLLLTEEVITKQGYGVTRIKAETSGVLAQVWETIAFGGFVSFYLALLHKIDPAPIPWVDYFKSKLK